MKEHGLVDTVHSNSKAATPLVERMDPVIGEATSVMGAMVTEMLRRTLRSGVTKVGEELDGFVAERVDSTIHERAPVIEQIAVEVADKCAREAATEVAVGEVRALEERTREVHQNLAGQIAETEKSVRQATEQTAQQLAGQIAETEKSVRRATEQTAQQLASQIAEAERAARQATDQTAERLVGQIAEATRTVQQATEQTAERLVGQIAETERRVGETVNTQVNDFLERARKGTAVLKAKIESVSQSATKLSEQVTAEQGERRSALAAIESTLRSELQQLLKANAALTARVAELEKPRGLRALWAWVRGLFGGRKASMVKHSD